MPNRLRRQKNACSVPQKTETGIKKLRLQTPRKSDSIEEHTRAIHGAVCLACVVLMSGHMKTDDIIAELIESWINGNRKYVATEVARRSRRFYMAFVTAAAAHFTEVDSSVFLKLIADARSRKGSKI